MRATAILLVLLLTLAPAMASAVPVWIPRLDNPEPRLMGAAGWIGQRLYVSHGFGFDSLDGTGMLQSYDATLDQWRTLAPARLPRWHPASAVLDGKMYVLGGYTSRCPDWTCAEVEEFDPAFGGHWRTMPPLPAPRFAAVATGHAGSILVFGGNTETTGGLTDTVLEYSVATGTTTIIGSMPEPRAYAALARLGDRVYIIGGDTPSGATDTVRVFDLATRTWSEAPPLPLRTYALSAGACAGDIVAFGGAQSAGESWILSPGAPDWVATGPLLFGRSYLPNGDLGGPSFLVAPGGSDGATTVLAMPCTSLV